MNEEGTQQQGNLKELSKEDLIHRLVDAYEKIAQLEQKLINANTDPLTKFLTRSAFFSRLYGMEMPSYLAEQKITSFGKILSDLRNETNVCIVSLDLRLLKQANGLPGLHKNGDLVIQIAAKCLESVGFSLMGRPGGDEFLFFTRHSKEQARELCELANTRMKNNWKVILELHKEGRLSSNNFALEIVENIKEALVSVQEGTLSETEIPSHSIGGISIYTDYGIASMQEASETLEKLLLTGWNCEKERPLAKLLMDISMTIAEVRLEVAKLYNKAFMLYQSYVEATSPEEYQKEKDLLVPRGSLEDYVLPSPEWKEKDEEGLLVSYIIDLVIDLVRKKHSGNLYEEVTTEGAVSAWV